MGVVCREWLGYALPLLLLGNAALIVWLRFMRQEAEGGGAQRLKRSGEVVVVTPPDKSAVEQLMVLQQAIARVEAGIQAVNIALLKARALFLSETPQVWEEEGREEWHLVVQVSSMCLRMGRSPAKLVTARDGVWLEGGWRSASTIPHSTSPYACCTEGGSH